MRFPRSSSSGRFPVNERANNIKVNACKFATSMRLAPRGVDAPYASFEVNEGPNCLVIIREDESIEKVYNDPTVPHSSWRATMYLVD